MPMTKEFEEHYAWPKGAIVEEHGVQVGLGGIEEMVRRYGEYSSTCPTGVIFGKRWMANLSFRTDKPAEWWVGEYCEPPPGWPAGEVQIKWRRVIDAAARLVGE